MLRRSAIAALTVLAVAVLASVGHAATAPSPPHGALTAAEYQTLEGMQARIKGTLTATTRGWQAAYAGCQAANPTTLLRLETIACSVGLHELQQVFAVASAVREESKCILRSHSSAVSCLLPSYQALDDAARATVTVDNETYRAAVARGFTGTCLYTLANTPASLAKEARFAQLMDETVAAMQTGNGPELRKLGPEITRALNAVLNANSPSNLAVCRHQ